MNWIYYYVLQLVVQVRQSCAVMCSLIKIYVVFFSVYNLISRGNRQKWWVDMICEYEVCQQTNNNRLMFSSKQLTKPTQEMKVLVHQDVSVHRGIFWHYRPISEFAKSTQRRYSWYLFYIILEKNPIVNIATLYPIIFYQIIPSRFMVGQSRGPEVVWMALHE